ncbi:hypothetical protein AB3A00_003488 [Vibrio cholerae]
MIPWDENRQWVEGDLYFDFSKAQSAYKLDQDGAEGHGLSRYFKSVDFVVEWTNQFWLVEVKDPENGKIPQQHRTRQLATFEKNLKSGHLIEERLFPKFRDSLIYLGLDKGIPKLPLKYISLIGLESLQPAELSGLKSALWNKDWIKGPARGWSKDFEVHCMNVTQWNRNLSICPITRISQSE